MLKQQCLDNSPLVEATIVAINAQCTPSSILTTALVSILNKNMQWTKLATAPQQKKTDKKQ